LFRRNEEIKQSVSSLQIHDFNPIRNIGAGSFGEVQIVKSNSISNEVFALKRIQKFHAISCNQQQNIQNEKELLYQCVFPFISTLYHTYQDDYCLYFLMEFIPGGELFMRINSNEISRPGNKVSGLPLEDAKFYTVG
jgi:serine/threonine protein kinase